MPRNTAKYPDHLLPDREMRAAWRQRGAIADDPEYDRRWLAFWKATLDTCRDQRTWDDRDVGLLAEYVSWVRQAEDHRAEAEGDPYQTHAESGRVFAHPGFALERAARQEARIVAAQLVLTPEARAELGIEEGGDDDGPKGDQAGL